jgi:PhnB protein
MEAAMTPIPYLFFKGTCEQAVRAYAQVFRSPEPEIMFAKDAPQGEDMGDDPQAVMHAALRLGDGWLYASDYSRADRMAGAAINVTMPDVAEGRRVFEALAEGGEVEMPFGPTFWDPGFGTLTDRFGTRWMVSTESGSAGA